MLSHCCIIQDSSYKNNKRIQWLIFPLNSFIEKKNGKERTTIPFDISFPFVWVTNKNTHKDLHNELSSHINSMF